MLNMVNSDKINEYIQEKGNVSVKMICKKFGVTPKIGHRILKYNQNTILDSPKYYGSNKFINYNLYRFANEDEIKNICNKETESFKKKYTTDDTLNNFMESGFSKYMMNRYRIMI